MRNSDILEKMTLVLMVLVSLSISVSASETRSSSLSGVQLTESWKTIDSEPDYYDAGPVTSTSWVNPQGTAFSVDWSGISQARFAFTATQEDHYGDCDTKARLRDTTTGNTLTSAKTDGVQTFILDYYDNPYQLDVSGLSGTHSYEVQYANDYCSYDSGYDGAPVGFYGPGSSTNGIVQIPGYPDQQVKVSEGYLDVDNYNEITVDVEDVGAGIDVKVQSWDSYDSASCAETSWISISQSGAVTKDISSLSACSNDVRVKVRMHNDGSNSVSVNSMSISGVSSSNPSPSNFNPSDGVFVEPNPTLSVDYWDEESNSGDVTFYAGDGSSIGSCYSVSSGSRCSTVYSSADSSGSYSWYVEATDEDGTDTSATRSFNVNNPPQQPSSPNPYDGEIGVSTAPSISATYTDPDGDSGKIVFYTGSGSKIGECSTYSGGSCSVSYSSASSRGTTYSWYAVANDTGGSKSTAQSPTWSFETEKNDAPSLSNIYPNGDSEVALNPDISVTYYDSESDSGDLDITTHNSQTFSKNGFADGETRTFAYSDSETLSECTTYTYSLEITDSYGGSTVYNPSFTTQGCSILQSLSNTVAPKGTLWVQSSDLHWADGSTEYWLEDASVANSNSSGPSGALWIQGTKIHWIDQLGDERSYQGSEVATNVGGPSGALWVQNGYIHYIDQDGDERVTDGK